MRVLVTLLLLLCPFAVAQAKEGDLQQTISDLSSQTDDKERLDAQGATKLELSQVRGWITEATNAFKEEKEELCRKLFERIRAQLKLVDQLVALDKVETEVKRLEDALASAKKAVAEAKKRLEEKQVQLRAMQMSKQ